MLTSLRMTSGNISCTAFVGATTSRPYTVRTYIFYESIFVIVRLLPPLTRSPSLSEGGYYIICLTLNPYTLFRAYKQSLINSTTIPHGQTCRYGLIIKYQVQIYLFRPNPAGQSPFRSIRYTSKILLVYARHYQSRICTCTLLRFGTV